MEPVTGIFGSRRAAENAVDGLRAIGLPEDAIVFLSPEHSKEVSSVPTTDAESPGMGRTLGSYVGGVIGGGVGMGAGSAVASLLVPGVGLIFAAGLGAGALLGLGGAVAGRAIGEATEEAGDTGVPRDDVLLYRELLKRGRSLVIASPDNEAMSIAAKAVLEKRGAEDVEAVRREWDSMWPDRAA
jgi:hypothetical protein